MLALFADNLLPVFLTAAAGYLLADRLEIDTRPLTHVVFYVLVPCLIFEVILGGRVGGDAFLRMAAYTLTVLLTLAAATALVARSLQWSRARTAAIVLVVLLPNAGNYGLAVNRFAFGEEGLAQAGAFFVTSSLTTFTLGVFVASMGRASLGTALAGLPRIPAVWAVVLAFLTARFGWTVPFPVERTVGLLADACIPMFLIILGMQLRRLRWRGPAGPLILASATRLLGGAAVGLALATVFGLEGAARQAGVLQSAMPSAVITIILATEYEIEPDLVTSVVFVTTVLSPLTLTPLLRLLGA